MFGLFSIYKMEIIYFFCFNNYQFNYRVDFYQVVVYLVIKLMKGENFSYLVKFFLYVIIQSIRREDVLEDQSFGFFCCFFLKRVFGLRWVGRVAVVEVIEGFVFRIAFFVLWFLYLVYLQMELFSFLGQFQQGGVGGREFFYKGVFTAVVFFVLVRRLLDF